VSLVAGFPQTLHAGSQVFSLDNTTVVSPTATWEQRFGFVRQIANATTSQSLTPSSIGITLPNGELFPGFTIYNADAGATLQSGGVVGYHSGNTLTIGPSTNFANAGIAQNEFEGSSKYNWVLGRHAVSFGGTFDFSQLNVENRENDVAIFEFETFADFLTGLLNKDKSTGLLLDGETNRHFRSKEAGMFIQDDIQVTPSLTVNLGVRWDWDGPLYEANGLMTSFYPKDYGYDLATDTFNAVNGTPGLGIVVAGNNPTLGTKGVSDSTLTGRQWGFAPRIGVAWSLHKNFVLRAGIGMFYNRGEYFTELSNSAGLGISGPFSVTTQEPFTVPLSANCGTASPTCSTGCTTALNCLSSAPFGTSLPAPPSSLAEIANLVPDMREMAGCDQATAPGMQQVGQPYCDVNSYPPPRPFLFGGYDPANKLP
jgi:TonB dependent receptor-like, beta-barrel